VIIARGGSKGLPRKNILLTHKVPLIAWSIRSAKSSVYLDRVVVSTDDSEIATIAERYEAEVPFLRTEQAATDAAPGVAAVLDTLERLDKAYDLVVMLQPTSPLRIREDIDGAIEMCAKDDTPAVIGIYDVTKSVKWAVSLDAEGSLTSVDARGSDYVLCRQMIKDRVYAPNGAVYVARTPWLKERRSFMSEGVKGYIMPPERSIDIDSKLDHFIAEALLKDQNVTY
jgi:N-acylneuraminate cytidylyltransferase